MNRKERLTIFNTNLREIVKERREGSFAIFNASHDKFVQFAGDKEMGLVCDIPLTELSEDEERRLLALEEFATQKGAVDANTEEQISYQASYEKEDVNKAAELTERIFIQVFKLPVNYSIVAELKL